MTRRADRCSSPWPRSSPAAATPRRCASATLVVRGGAAGRRRARRPTARARARVRIATARIVVRHPRPGLGPVLDDRASAGIDDAAQADRRRRLLPRAGLVLDLERMRRYIDEAVADQPDGLVVSLPDAQGARAVDPAPRSRPASRSITINSGSGRVQAARRARPRRPGRVPAPGVEAGERMGRAGVRRALCVNQDPATAASTSAAAGSPTVCGTSGAARASSRSRCRTPRVAQNRLSEKITAGIGRRHPPLGPGGAAPALAAAQAACRSIKLATSISRPRSWRPCATARCCSRSTSSPTCRATCR